MSRRGLLALLAAGLALAACGRKGPLERVGDDQKKKDS